MPRLASLTSQTLSGLRTNKFPVRLLLTLDNPNGVRPAINDNFGYSVAIANSYIIVGTPGEQATVQGDQTGAAYIFDLTTGALVHTLENPTPNLNDRFGYSVAIDDNIGVVGAPGEDVDGVNSGNVYVYNVETDTQLVSISNPNDSNNVANDEFGWAVDIDISSSRIIVSAPFKEDLGSLNNPFTFVLNEGRVYVYDLSGTLLDTITNPRDANGQTNGFKFFGDRVKIDGDYAVIKNNSATVPAVYVYNLVTKTFMHQLTNTPTTSIDVSGDYAIVGAAADGVEQRGRAYIYNIVTNTLLHTLDNPNSYNASAADQFGYSVAISGNYCIVTAPLRDDGGADSGKAYIYNVTTGVLLRTLNNPNAYRVTADDQFGHSVAMNGSRIIVGVPYEDNAGGGDDSGVSYIYSIG
jgi:hypothetical protein